MSATAEKVMDIVNDLKRADELRAPNRALIQRQMNGEPPFSPAQMAENKIDVSLNTKTGTNLLAQANRQWNNAFTKSARYFSITLEDAPIDRGMEWANILTKEANRPLKRSRDYYHQVRSTGGGVMLTGVGAKMWTPFDDSWCPYFIAIEDLLIPSDTQLTLDMDHFAVRRGMSYWELFSKTIKKGKNIDPGWNVPVVKAMLAAIKDENVTQEQWDWTNSPEKAAEQFKQNATYWNSDAIPKIWLWDFLSRDDESGEWNLQIVPDENWTATYGTTNEPLDFVYDSKKPVADTLDKILHCQFGDGNVKPPYLYHSIRSLAWLLFDLCQIQDMATCRFIQKVFEDMMLLMRISDPADRAAIDKIHFGLRYGLLPDGVSFVKRDERYEFDPELSQMLFSNLRQHMGESASSYTADIDAGTEKERTKFEVQSLLAQTSALLSSLLNGAYIQAEFEYREICRRLCLEKSRDKDAIDFQKRCLQQGVPREWLDTTRWEVRADQIGGGGSKQLELAGADKLMSVRQFMTPSAQQKVLHDLVLAVTDSSAKANELAPLHPDPITDSVFDAALSWGTLYSGAPMPIKQTDSHREFAQTLLKMLGSKVQQIATTDNMGTPADIVGLTTVAGYIGQHLQALSEDESEKQNVKQMSDTLGKIGNLVKAFSQRQQEAARQSGNGHDPEVAAKVQAIALTTQAKVQAKAVADRQKLQQKDAQFRQKMAHEHTKLGAEMFEHGVRTTLEGHAQATEAQAAKKAVEKKTAAEVEAIKAKADAAAETTAE